MRRRAVVSVILLVILVFMLGINAYCTDDRSFYMSSFKINAQLDSAGNMDITEEITYEFDGSFRGVYRTLKTKGSDGIDSIQVYKKQGDKLVEFVQDNSEGENTYQIIDDKDGITLKIFSASKDESKDFVIAYRVLNAAVKYRDVGELYWRFMGEDTEVRIENFQVVITLPKGAEKEDLRVFGHGLLSGVSEILDSRRVSLRVEKLLPRNSVEARVLFPTELISGSKRVVNKETLSEILSEEAGFAAEANAARGKARILLALSLVIALLELFVVVYLYFKYDREYKPKFKGEYYRELPGSYSPAVLSVLWNFGKVNPRDITATMMDLVRRRYLRLMVEQQEIRGLIKHKIENEYIFELDTSARPDTLSPHEKFLIDWLIVAIGDGSRVSLKDIEQYSKTTKRAEIFKANYDAWEACVKREADSYSFFDRNTIKGQIYGIVAAVLGLLYGGYTAAAHGNTAGFIVLLITSVAMMIYSLAIRRRSRYGAEQYKMWKAFRRFLKHFSMLDKAELPAVSIWEHYLVYAITLGVAKEVISQLKVVFREEDFKNTALTYMYYGHYGHSLNHFDAISNVTNSMVKATESVYTQALSKTSSESGSGGGFSGGGGGGGGGGGAGAF